MGLFDRLLEALKNLGAQKAGKSLEGGGIMTKLTVDQDERIEMATKRRTEIGGDLKDKQQSHVWRSGGEGGER